MLRWLQGRDGKTLQKGLERGHAAVQQRHSDVPNVKHIECSTCNGNLRRRTRLSSSAPSPCSLLSAEHMRPRFSKRALFVSCFTISELDYWIEDLD